MRAPGQTRAIMVDDLIVYRDRILEVVEIAEDEIAACIPGREHAGHIWIKHTNVNSTAGTEMPVHGG